jgi:hypothetical protein
MNLVRLAVLTMLALIMLIPSLVVAAPVGRFTQVEGQVGLLKQGKLPAVVAKVQDGVEPGDMVRTKSRSRAQITFVDDTILTLAPESRITVADYMYDEAQGSRRAVLRVFRGLVHAAVTRLLQVEEPNFIMETHSAVIGVRGTDWYTLLMPNFTSVYLVNGLLDVKSNQPQIPAVLPLQAMQFTQVVMGLQPQLAKPVTPAMLQMLRKMMNTGIRDHVQLGGAPHLGGGPEVLEEFKLPVSPDQMPQPIIPPQLIPPVQEHRSIITPPGPGN